MAGEEGRARPSLPPLTDCTFGGAAVWLTSLLKAAGIESPGLDARRLIGGCAGVAPGDVLLLPETRLSDADCQRLEAFAARRVARAPVSRILGVRAFHGHDFEIGPDTLDPRPETETLVDGVLELLASGEVGAGAAPRILDLGVGSGAILLSLLAALPDARGVGCDISGGALAVAGRNAVRLGVEDRCQLLQSDWLAAIEGRFELIVSNPPYIPHGMLDALDAEVRLHDPVAALDGGNDGLVPYRHLVPACARYMAEGGWLVLEIGSEQAESVLALGEKAPIGQWVEKRLWRDLAGKPRCVAMRHQS